MLGVDKRLQPAVMLHPVGKRISKDGNAVTGLQLERLRLLRTGGLDEHRRAGDAEREGSDAGST